VDETLRKLAPVYTVLFLRNMAWSLTINGPVMPLYARALGLDVASWGLLAMALSAGLFMEFVWGVISDRVNKGYFILTALILTSLIYPLYTVKAFLPLFIVFQFVFGAIQVIVGLTTRAVIAETSPGKSAGFNMSLWFFFATLGNIAGPIVGTTIATSLGYEYAFYTSMGIVWAATLFFLATYLRDREPRVPATMTRRPFLIGFSQLLRIPTIQKTCTLTLLGFLGCSVVGSFLPIYATEKVGMTTIAVGSMATIAASARLVTSPLIGRISDRIDKRKMLFATLSLGCVLFALYPYATEAWQFTLLTAGVSATFSFGVLSIAIHSSATPKELGGMSLGLYGTFEDFGLMLGSLIFGFAYVTLGPSSIFIITAAAIGLAALLSLSLPKGKQ
jgi:MFS transporter, DHA1 family, multidrug resistance protein